MEAGMQKLMGHALQGPSQEFPVQLDDLGILMGLADMLAFIDGVNGIHTLLQYFRMTGNIGLAAAVDAAAGTGHDFN